MTPPSGARRTRLFGIAIANEFSSEVRVMSTLLGYSPSIDAQLVINGWTGHSEAARRVAELSSSAVRELDLGWRHSGQNGSISRIKRLSAFALRLLWSLPRVVRIAHSHKPDVIYSSQQKWDCAVASLVATVLRRPHIIHLHYVPGPWLGKFTLWRLRRVPLVIGVSDFIRVRVIEAGSDPSHATKVLNPIHPFPELAKEDRTRVRASLGILDDEVAIGFVSRVVPDKGHIESIMAFAALGDDLLRSRLFIVGDGELLDQLGELANSLGVSDRVIFTGKRDDIPSLLASFDFFVHPSYEDPCPLAVLEAQAAGLPVVAFDEGGITEIVADGATGLLAPDRNVNELTQRLRQLIGDPVLRRSMGSRARDRTLTVFDPSTTAQAFVRAINSVC